MPHNTVRIPAELHARLKKLAKGEGGTLLSVLQRAVERYDRERFLEEVNAGYAALRDDPKAWAEELAERRLWDGTLADGLDPDDPILVRETPRERAKVKRRRRK